MKYIEDFLKEGIKIIESFEKRKIQNIVDILVKVRNSEGRIFFLGVGGGAGHASHAVNDFRKIAKIESYSPADNVSELTARINDDGWDTSYANWLMGSKVNKNDCLFIFSVGGGSLEKNISVNIINSIKLAKEVGAKVVGVVGKNGGYTKEVADEAIVISSFNANTVTPQTESFQAFIWHLIVSHPDIIKNQMKWESIV